MHDQRVCRLGSLPLRIFLSDRPVMYASLSDGHYHSSESLGGFTSPEGEEAC